MPSPAEPSPSAHRGAALRDARGITRLAVDAVVGVTDIVEDVHRTITRLALPLGSSRSGRMRGIPGFVYRRIRGTTHLVGDGIDAALERLAPHLGGAPSQRRDALVAVLNGVVGDHLAATGNALAIRIRLHHAGRPLVLDRPALAERFGTGDGRLLVLAHGLCMDEQAWRRDGHDHGAALAHDLGVTPLYLRYNSGRRIAENGRDLAHLLARLTQVWPVPIREITIVGHSMGGLVARSACHVGAATGDAWTQRLQRLVFLGTPHHGAPLERLGHGVDRALGLSPYTAPFARLGLARSRAVQDLRYGTILGEGDRAHAPTVPLPDGVACFAVAATRQGAPGGARTGLPSDGLVPVASALARPTAAALSLGIPEAHQHIAYGLHHFGLLSDRSVYERLRGWLGRAEA